MCGACGARGTDHWSAPFLASHPARAAAARAATALAAPRVRVTATAGGYLVSTPTGRSAAAGDLGAVWEAARAAGGQLHGGIPPPSPADLLGPATLPPPRPSPASVVLVSDEPPPAAYARIDVDARGWSPEETVTQLLAHSTRRRPGVVHVQIHPGEVDQLLPHLRASPTRPFAVIVLGEQGAPAPRVAPLPPGARWLDRIPALLAWLAGVDGTGAPRGLHLRLPLPDQRVLALDVLHGTVTRCAAEAAEAADGQVPLALPGDVTGDVDPLVAALLGP